MRVQLFPTVLVAACAGFLSACPTRTNPDAAGLKCDHSTHVCVGTLAITQPGQVAYTNGMITIQVDASPSDNPPLAVRIRKNQMPLATVPPPFTYPWNTSATPEGSYQIDAVADVGADTVMAQPVTIWVDRTPPSIDTRVPVQNATNVALPDPIQVKFTETLDPSSVSTSAVSVSSGGSTLSSTAKLASDGKTINVTLDPRAVTSFPATITATVNPAVKDLAGNSVGAIPSWSWSAPLWVNMPALPGRDPSVAIDSTGIASVTYLAVVPSTVTTAPAVVRYGPGATWDLGRGSPTSPETSATATRIAIGKDDMPLVAWSEGLVRAARWNGAAWEQVGGDLNAGISGFAVVTSIASGSSGQIVAGWSGQSGSSNLGYVASWPMSGSAWQTIPPGDTAGPGGPSLRIDQGGDVIGLFPGSLNVLPVLRRYTGGAWTDVDSFASDVGLVVPALALDVQGRALIVTHALESGLEVIRLRAYGPSSWMAPTPALPTGSSRAIGTGQVAVAANGDVLVLWTQTDTSSHSRVHVARFRESAWDTTYGVLSGSSNGDTLAAAFDVDAAGVPTVAWQEKDSSDSMLVWRSNY